eukprot:TRINITY_DN499_c0_g1_i9.p2 TRINITY_DN499_c0_g1~~TRINITY_DN499_c0_g1_i9.p2  ORF type:complete len:174 (+),score=38.78 TRINITY_DN499_c0_g1_i9:589-1110(+)
MGEIVSVQFHLVLERNLYKFAPISSFNLYSEFSGTNVVTLWYRAPEVLLGSQTYSKPIDIWSIGCVFGEMKTGRPMFPGRNAGDQLIRIFKGLGTPTEEEYPDVVNLPKWNKKEIPVYEGRGLRTLVPGLDEEGYDLISRMLKYDPAKRITAQGAMEHPFLAEQREAAANKRK